MQLLKKRILQDGKCYEGGILKVDSFINHQMDPVLMKSIGVEFVRLFAGTNVNKIMTIEASGIAGHHDGLFDGLTRRFCQEKVAKNHTKCLEHYSTFIH